MQPSETSHETKKKYGALMDACVLFILDTLNSVTSPTAPFISGVRVHFIHQNKTDQGST